MMFTMFMGAFGRHREGGCDSDWATRSCLVLHTQKENSGSIVSVASITQAICMNVTRT